MATVKAPYDPIKAVEGMFNGSVTRIAYALKDPQDYGESTRTVLTECAKRFHDALDDCEIQLLDAKWYLEYQLQSNKIQRELKAQELRTAAKRKYDELREASDQSKSEEVAPKKVRVEPIQEERKPTEAKGSRPSVEPSSTTAVATATAATGNSAISTSKPPIATKTPARSNKQETEVSLASDPETDLSKPQAKPPPLADEPVKAASQATPSELNDDFNFESMFGEPTADLMNEGAKEATDYGFDLPSDVMRTSDNIGGQDIDSPDSLLPGLESYANQTDDFLGPNSINDGANTASNTKDLATLPAFSNDFNLPDMTAPNDFDDYLNDDNFGAADGGDNFVDNVDLSGSGLFDMDFDTAFS